MIYFHQKIFLDESMLRQKAAQQTRQQPVPINRLAMNQQPSTSNRQQDNFSIYFNLNYF